MIYNYLYTPLVTEKPIFWVGSSLGDIREFPEDARRIVGHCLHLIQQGLEPPDRKAMPSVGSGVYEIRIHTRIEHRVLYLTKFSEGIYVLHAFQKKTRRTPASDLDIARRRLKELVRERGSQRNQG
jgi:phage-related protein